MSGALADGMHIDLRAQLAAFADDPDIAAMADLSEDEFELALAQSRTDGGLSRAAVATKASAMRAANGTCLGCGGQGRDTTTDGNES